jgi:hypothetical protein
MNRLSRLLGSAAIGLAGIAATAIADGPSATGYTPGGWRAHGRRAFDRCLSSVGLSESQQADIDAARANAKTTLGADFAALKAVREKLKADLANGADKSVLGQDTLDQDAAVRKLKDDHKAARDQIVATLNPDQKNTLDTCMQQHRGPGTSEEPAQE